jgi:hypothetical protein
MAKSESRELSLFLHSSDSVLRVLMHTVTVQGWSYAKEKLEGVAEIVAVVTIESVRAIVDCELRPDTDVEAVAVR